MSDFASKFGPSDDWKRRLYAAAIAGLLLAVAACQQKMAKQPSFRPQEETSFYPDGRSARPLELGTIPIGQQLPDDPLMTGLTPDGRKAKTRVDQAAIPGGAPDSAKNYVDVFPFKMTKERLMRGLDRYKIFCTECHGTLGDGNGKIVERGNLKPTSYYENSRGFGRYHIDLSLEKAPVGYFFEVITKGYGGMPNYSAQISPEDRWCIIAYIRALQMSQGVSLNDLPKDVQDAAKQALETAPTKPGEGAKP